MKVILIPSPVVIAMVALLVAAQEAPEKPPPTFGAETALVVVDVAVVDGQGRAVSSLNQDDFVVLEDGAPQRVVSFTVAAAPDPPGPDGEPRSSATESSGGPASASGRTIGVLFDDLGVTLFQGERLKTALTRFLREHTAAGDEIWLVSPGAGLGRAALMPAGADGLLQLVGGLKGRRLVERSAQRLSDTEALDIAARRDFRVEERVMRRFIAQDPSLAGMDRDQVKLLVDALATQVHAAATTRLRATLGVVQRTLERLSGRKGRKSLILASVGFGYDADLPEFRTILQASLRANTAIYFLDARGLQGLAPFQDVETAAVLDSQDYAETRFSDGLAAQGAEMLATDTGGFTIRNINNLAEGLRIIADTSRSYYLLGYNPSNQRQNGKFRKITVRLRSDQGGLKVMARRGYFAPKS